MYSLTIAVLLLAALALIVTGVRHERVAPVVWGIAVAALTFALFSFLEFWGEALWFEATGYGRRFWTVVLSKAVLAIAVAAASTAIVYLLTRGLDRGRPVLKLVPRLAAAYVGAHWGIASWDKVLLFIERVPAGVRDPILDRDAGFYLFTLPFLNAVFGLLLLLTIIALLAWAIGYFVRVDEEGISVASPSEMSGEGRGRYPRGLYWSVAAFLVVLAWGAWLNRYELLYSTLGVVAGPGWTDVHIRLPAYVLLAVLLLAAAVTLVVPQVRAVLERLAERRGPSDALVRPFPFLVAGAIPFVLWLLLLVLLPAVVQWLRVVPNEITVEAPYIEHNIEFTRRAFKLDTVEEREFPVTERFAEQMVRENRGTFDNVRLWDWRALTSVYEQFQEIRLYYDFQDVDVDRYSFADDYREVMVSAREMNLENLPPQSQTFVNERFKYTHGYGVTLTTVSEFTRQGLPNLLVKDIPPKAEHLSLEVERPEIYYGELTDEHVIVDTEEEEFDYPNGEENVYSRYQGEGGVRLNNLWRRLVFGWKFDGTPLLVSSYPNEESQILFHRRVQDRVRTLAPFLSFDNDPYVVLADGKLYWIVDAYTTSDDYPYSEPFESGIDVEYDPTDNFFLNQPRLRGINYIRNSVKVVVDAYEGSVDFYVFEPDDPLIRAWQNVFPDMFKERSEMPERLAAHIRYPSDMLLTQGLVFAKYHMTDPTVFYNQEDLWMRATEKYYGAVQPVEPYYIMWEPPESNELEFILMMPFTPKNRQVLIGWIAGMCDGEDYGRLLAYKFPKEKRVLGTQQMETKIDQDSYLSGQLSLWDQHGSRVIRGNVLAIPVEETVVYVEPIYLRAETAAYPELRLVAVMHNDNLSYAPTFGEALNGLFGEGPAREAIGIGRPAGAEEVSSQELARRANNAFNAYLQALGSKNFERAGSELAALQNALQRLSGSTPSTRRDTTGARP